MKRRAWVCITIACLASFAGSALAATQTARMGDISAKFSFRGKFPYRSKRLTIERSGVVAYSRPVESKLCGTYCGPGWAGTRKPSIHVVDLKSGGEPNVVLDLFSGGAHCCFLEQVFSFDSTTMTYRKAEYDFGNPGVRLADLDHNGMDQFLSADNSFAYEFTDYAGSAMPVRIVRFANGRFINVTRSYPQLIAKDAQLWKKAFDRLAPSYKDSVGVIAAWAADEDELGQRSQVARYLAAQLAAGHVNTALSPLRPSAKKFLAHLNRFLRAHGYLG